MIAGPNPSLRERFASDFHRPIYHYLPPSNWMNDPNGIIQWQGLYHLFYQYNPFGAVWSNMHWGHAVSRDLVHWEDWPIALSPTPGGPDEAGCFSGCAIIHEHPTLVYTGARGIGYEIQTQCIATSHDNFLTWEKYLHNPVLSEVPAVSGQTADFRDPFVWREADGWYMLLASQIKSVGGAVFLYRSDNLIDWEYLHPLLVGDNQRNGTVWECPNFFPLGDRWVLIISAHMGSGTATVFYFVGSYTDHHFTPEVEGVLDYAQLYAPLTTLDEANRRLMIGWIRETRTDNEMRHAGWSGAQSIPRILALDSHKRLLMTPVPELDSLHGATQQIEMRDLNGEIPLETRGWALDMAGEFALQPDGWCALTVACAPDARERTDILYEAAHQRLTVRTTTFGTEAVVLTTSRTVPHQLNPDENLTLRVLWDGSVLEIIANQRTSLTHRLYPTLRESSGVRLSGSQSRVIRLDIREMPSIWQ
ncbi:MAG: glycoside hydrolase family 32 protein [Anaerolineae bacterium]|nr:glycoside hydrolase family 32 protein [Anaerolineae bacterium]